MSRIIQGAEAVEVVCLCEGEWYLCDARIPSHDSKRLISYVERAGLDFEVLWFPTFAVQHMDSFEAAVEAARYYCATLARGSAKQHRHE
jgi:hypothetical protein